MKLRLLKCPQCGGTLEIEKNIDTFYCKYCGTKIFMDDLSPEAYKTRVRIRFIDKLFSSKGDDIMTTLAAIIIMGLALVSTFVLTLIAMLK
jgi:DNA-directed RNA polymerase subunit RPC12/RpoP